jgi:hypothetical protein
MDLQEEDDGLRKIAAAVESELHQLGFTDARCRGHFQFGLHSPDARIITLKRGSYRNAARVRDSFDMKHIHEITKLFADSLSRASQ